MRLYLNWHLGMGDAIICNGMVRELRKKYDEITVPCYKHNEASVKFMFSDDPNIKIAVVANDWDAKDYGNVHFASDEVLGIGCKSKEPLDFARWDADFYRQAGVPFERRWDSFHLARCAGETEPWSTKYTFIHDDSSRGFCIDSSKVGNLPMTMRPFRLAHIFLWRKCIEEANEIHCIDSSFLSLADSLILKAEKLFLHCSGCCKRETAPPHLRYAWKIV